jgi:hypothetical protein
MSNRKIRYRIGDVVAIPLYMGGFGYGHILTKTIIEFYEIHSTQLLPVEEVISQPVLFKLWVDDEAVSNGAWQIIGNTPLSKDLQKIPLMFIWSFLQDIPHIISETGEMIPATVEECQGLEKANMWGPDAVRCRLQDALTGKGDRWIQRIEQDE